MNDIGDVTAPDEGFVIERDGQGCDPESTGEVSGCYFVC